MYGLIKIANEQEEQTNHLGTGIGAGAGLAVASPKTTSRITGLQRVYHGTSKENAEGIMQEGLLASKGGKNGATFEESGNVAKSLGKVHLTAKRQVGNYHANFHDIPKDELFVMNSGGDPRLLLAPKRGKGVVLSGLIPYAKYDQMELDPVYNAPILKGLPESSQNNRFIKQFLRDQASRGEVDVLPIELDGAGYSLKARLRHYGGHFPTYLKNYPGRFAGGTAMAAGGLATGAYLGNLLIDPEVPDEVV